MHLRFSTSAWPKLVAVHQQSWVLLLSDNLFLFKGAAKLKNITCFCLHLEVLHLHLLQKLVPLYIHLPHHWKRNWTYYPNLLFFHSREWLFNFLVFASFHFLFLLMLRVLQILVCQNQWISSSFSRWVIKNCVSGNFDHWKCFDIFNLE